MFTLFMDMHSGGGKKESFEQLAIEAPMKEAEMVFYHRFGHSPYRVSCACCGEDYSLSEHESYTELLRCGYKPDAVILKEDIKPEEREGELPQQGYVWV